LQELYRDSRPSFGVKLETYRQVKNMGRKYSDIDRAEELLAAYNAKKSYLGLSKTEKSAAYAVTAGASGGKRLRVGTEPGFLKVFGGEADAYVRCKLLSAANLKGDAATGETDTPLIAVVVNAVYATNLYATLTLPNLTAVTLISFPKVQGLLAKVSLTKRTGDVKLRTSRVTKRPYKAKASNTASCVFGALITGSTVATATYSAAVDVLKTALIGPGSEGLSVSFKPQGNISVA